MASFFRRFFERQERVTLEKLLGAKTRAALLETKEFDARRIFDTEDWKRQLREDADTFLSALFEQYGDETADEILAIPNVEQFVFNVADPNVRALIAERVNLIVGVNDTTFTRIQKALDRGLQEGESVPQIAKRVRRVFKAATQARALTIARTETLTAANGASFLSAQQSGIVSMKVWIAALDHRVRDDHAAAHLQSVPLSSAFNIGGSSMMFPHDPAGPAEQTINCRCVLTYTVRDSITSPRAFGR